MTNSNFKILFCYLVLFVALNATSAHNVVDTVCSKTKNPSFCTSTLKSASGMDLKGLATFTLNLAHINAKKSQTLAKSQAAMATNPQLKQRYSSCSNNYDEVVGNIENAQKCFASGDFDGLNTATFHALMMVNDCKESFNQPPTDMSSLLNDGKNLKDISIIILIISNVLSKSM